MSKIITSLHGRLLGIDEDNRLLVPKGLRHGEDGWQFDDASPMSAVLFDDFTGLAISATQFGVNKGSDAATVNFATLASQLYGVARATTGAGAGASMAVNGVQINGGLNYSANQDGVAVDIKVKISAITNIALFVGFTNQTSALQAPVTGSGAGDAFTYNAADAVGFVFDTAMTTKNLWAVGNKNSVAATAINSGQAPVAATFIRLRVELSKAGHARFLINGKTFGNVIMQNAVTPATLLTPVVTAFTRAAGSATVDVDYIYAGGDRES